MIKIKQIPSLVYISACIITLVLDKVIPYEQLFPLNAYEIASGETYSNQSFSLFLLLLIFPQFFYGILTVVKKVSLFQIALSLLTAIALFTTAQFIGISKSLSFTLVASCFLAMLELVILSYIIFFLFSLSLKYICKYIRRLSIQ